VTRNIKIIFILISSIILISCGYTRINQNEKLLIHIQNINIIGNKKISYKLKNNILIISNVNAKKKYAIEIQIKKKKQSKIKNTTGKTTRYNLSLSADIILKDINNLKKSNKSFIRNGDYDVANNYSDTVNNENNILKNLIEQLSDDIINFISTSTRK